MPLDTAGKDARRYRSGAVPKPARACARRKKKLANEFRTGRNYCEMRASGPMAKRMALEKRTPDGGLAMFTRALDLDALLDEQPR